MKIRQLPNPAVDEAAKWTLADVGALQAMEKGEASSAQQKRALDWILKNAAATGAQSYRPETNAMSFHEGRRFVGLQIVGLLKLDTRKLEKATNNG